MLQVISHCTNNHNVGFSRKMAINNTNTTIATRNTVLPNYTVSFGWCDVHNVHSNQISIILQNQLTQQEEIENEKAVKTKRLELLEIANRSNKEAINFLLNFTNRQKNEAEFIPLWAILNNDELHKTINKSKIFTDPVQTLLSLDLVQKALIKNDKLNTDQLEKSQGSLQLHSAVILLNQIEENINNPQSLAYQNNAEINELVSIIKESIDKIYGKNTYEKIKKLSLIGTNPNVKDKKESLDYMMFIDENAKKLNFGEEFSEKLNTLLVKQQSIEKSKMELEILFERNISMGAILSNEKRDLLQNKLKNSPSAKEVKAVQFMLDINQEIRFSKETLSPDEIHDREQLLRHAKHNHHKEIKDEEVDVVEVSYHEHTHEEGQCHHHN
jgi:hypothetical protein